MFILHHPDEHVHVFLINPPQDADVNCLVTYTATGLHGEERPENTHHTLTTNAPDQVIIPGPRREYNESVRVEAMCFFNLGQQAVTLRLFFHGIPNRSFPNGETTGMQPVLERTIPKRPSLLWERGQGWYVVGDAPV